MKRTERHHLKENELSTTLHDAFARIDQHRRQVTLGAAAVVVGVIALLGYSAWMNQRDAKAGALLAEALVISEAQVVAPAAPGATAPTPPPVGSYPTERAKLEAALPKFLSAADAYPSTRAGIAARFQAAATLQELGRDAEAKQRYDEVVARDGSGVHGRMARLGLAELHAKAKQYDAAVAVYKELAAPGAKGDLPVDALLMQMGRAYLAAGKKTEARQSFQRVADEFPASVYAGDARREIDLLKAGA